MNMGDNSIDGLVSQVEYNLKRQWNVELDRKVLDVISKVDRGEFIPYMGTVKVSGYGGGVYGKLRFIPRFISEYIIKPCMDKGTAAVLEAFVTFYSGYVNSFVQVKMDEDKTLYLEHPGSDHFFNCFRNLLMNDDYPASLEEHQVNQIISGMSAKEFTEFVVDRKMFVYNDQDLLLPNNQVAQMPSLIAYMAQKADLMSGMDVLEIGSGSGYSAAITSYLVGDSGHVVTSEQDSFLRLTTKNNLKKEFGDKYHKKISVISPDEVFSTANKGRFDSIIITCGFEKPSMVDDYKELLKPEGGAIIYSLQFHNFKNTGVLHKVLYGPNDIKEYDKQLCLIGSTPMKL